MMGVQLKPQFLKDINMGKVREHLAAAMYVETARADASMWDPEFVSYAMDAAVPAE